MASASMSPGLLSPARPNLSKAAKKWSWPDCAPGTKFRIENASMAAL
jgi:hypothetical protein